MSLRLSGLKPGKYVIYIEGLSEEDEKENYVFSVYSSSPFTLYEQQIQQNRHYFL